MNPPTLVTIYALSVLQAFNLLFAVAMGNREAFTILEFLVRER